MRASQEELIKHKGTVLRTSGTAQKNRPLRVCVPDSKQRGLSLL